MVSNSICVEQLELSSYVHKLQDGGGVGGVTSVVVERLGQVCLFLGMVLSVTLVISTSRVQRGSGV